jgi:hypothetical protein
MVSWGLTLEFTCILERSGKMSGATICYTFFNILLNNLAICMALSVGIFCQFG